MNALNLSAWAVKHSAIVLFLILAAGAAGVYAYLGMGRAEDPSFTIKTMVVTADWPGATSDEVQRYYERYIRPYFTADGRVEFDTAQAAIDAVATELGVASVPADEIYRAA